MGEQVGQVLAVIVVVGMNVIQEVNQPVTEVNIACFAAPQHGINDGSVFRGIVIAAEQPVFSTQGDGPDGIFPEVVVDFQPAVQMVTGQLVIDAIGVTDGLANPSFGQDLGIFIHQPLLKGNHYRV